MADPILTTTRPLLECPACGADVPATITVSMALGDTLDNGTVEARGTLTGVRITHDCTKQTPRTTDSKD